MGALGRTGLILALAILFVSSGALLSPAPVRAQAAPVRVVVAVLPFKIHSAQPLGHLERSLADLLESRLEASGRVTVVESLVVREAMLGYAGGDLTEEALRQLAAEVDADYVVAGSLTELAGRYSLDVRVTPVGEGISSHSLAYMAQGDDELLDRMNELADRILGVLAGESPRATVSEVRLVGAESLDPDPTPRLRVSVGSAYDAALASADLAMLKGFARFAEREAAPKGELEHLNAYTLLVAVALSAQATDKGVNAATRKLFAVADTPEKMLALGEEKLTEMIRTIGSIATRRRTSSS